jgi:hypothetical protein
MWCRVLLSDISVEPAAYIFKAEELVYSAW